MPNEFLDELQKAGLETDTQPDSSTGNKPDGTTPATEDKKNDENVPFHQHPRWKARETEWNQKLEAMKHEYEEQMNNLKKTVDEVVKPAQTSIPQWFRDMYGDDVPAWTKYSEASKNERAQIKSEILNELKAEQSKQTEEAKKWDNWVEKQISSLEDEGKKFDRNKLVKLMSDYRPVDEQGNYDFHKGYELYEKFESLEKKPNNTVRKDIASNSVSDNKGEASPKEYRTPGELRRTSWPRFGDN